MGQRRGIKEFNGAFTLPHCQHLTWKYSGNIVFFTAHIACMILLIHATWICYLFITFKLNQGRLEKRVNTLMTFTISCCVFLYIALQYFIQSVCNICYLFVLYILTFKRSLGTPRPTDMNNKQILIFDILSFKATVVVL